MADPVVHLTNGVPDGGTGNVTTLGQTLVDGANATFGITTGAAVITDTPGTLQQYLRGLVKTLGSLTNTANALDVNIKSGVNVNGSALAAGAAPVTQAPTSFRVAVTPTLASAVAYTANNVVGGVMTFANMLLPTPTVSPTKWSAILESICIKFKAATVTGEFDVAIFTSAPTGTYTDHAAPPAWTAADSLKLVGIYALTAPLGASLGTTTIYNLDAIGATIDGTATSLIAVVTTKGTGTPASTTDFVLELGVLQG